MSDTGGNPLLSVPTQVTVTDVTDKEIDPAAAGTLTAFGVLASGIIEHWFGIKAASMIDSAATVTAILTGNWDKMMALVGKFYSTAQGEQNSGFYDLCAAVLTDLTGVKVDATALKQSTFGSGRLAGMQTFGADLYNQLASEFAPTNGATLGPDAAPAERFLGFLMNFAIRQGNVSAMCDAIPEDYKFLTGFREYGELMAKNLGLGRMARRALQPLVQTLVADPLQWQLNAQYLPKRLAERDLIKAWFRGAVVEDAMRAEMAQAGYSTDRQNYLIADTRPILNDREIIHLYYRGFYDLDGLTRELTARGWDPSLISAVVEIERPQLTTAEILNLFDGSIGQGFGSNGLSESDTLSLLGKIGYDLNTASQVLAAHKITRTRAHRLSFAELHRMFLDAVIDLPQYQAYLLQLGYGDQDVTNLITQTLLDQKTSKATGGTKAIPKLSVAQLTKALEQDILTTAEVEAHLVAHGYAAPDVQTLLAEIQAAANKAAGAAAAANPTVTPPATS